MSPLEIYIDSKKKHTIPKNGGGYANEEVDIQYYGDNLGSGIVSGKDGYAGDFKLDSVGQESPPIGVVVGEVPSIEKGQPPTTIRQYVTVKKV